MEGVIAPERTPPGTFDCADDGTAENSGERKEIAVKLVINTICRRFRIRVSDQPKGTLTLRPTLPANPPENPEPEYR